MPTAAGCVVQHRYRVDPLDKPALLALLADVIAHAEDLGVARLEAWQDDDDPWQWTELHRFDSWGHYQRLAQKPLDPGMQETYEALARLQVGDVETRIWTPVLVSG